MATANSVPVKCPGCQAGFDVPATLAGKTIRCTSCKTQLTVPVAGAKTNPTAPKPAPAGPRPGAAAKGPPARSAAAALPRGRRRDDDDDDEDDDDDYDDRPRKKGKKKASSGGGAPVVPIIIGAVVLLVLAGGGAGAYFLLAKDKKPEAAANSSGGGSTTPPPMTPKMPGMPNVPTGGPGSGGVSSDGWKTVQLDGFSVEMPDWPFEKKNESNPLTGRPMSAIMAERPTKDGVLGIVSQDIPAEQQNRDPRDLIREGLNDTNRLLGAGLGGNLRITKKAEMTVDGHPGAELGMTDGGGKRLTIRLVIANKRMFMAVAGSEGKEG
ncbi:MAG TPA: hypothetical protein VH092_05865, partial [Urbifossiella sp.]|nr:hypothetical protein [Urbifossiella sp.]